MPNQRKKGKSQVNAWVSDGVKKKIKYIAEQEDRPMSDVVNDILKEWIANEEGDDGYGKSKRSNR